MMRIIFVGTGACIINSVRAPSSILIKVGDDNLLFDCGPGIAYRIAGMGINVSELKYIFITHFHVDHISDISAIVQDRIFTTGKPLYLYGPLGLGGYINLLFTKLHPSIGKSGCFDFLKIIEAHSGLCESTDTWEISVAPTKHAVSIAYRIDAKGKSILYSGDTAPCNEIVDLGRGVDIAILESSFPNQDSIKGNHLSPETAADLALKMDAKRLVLTHLLPECYGKEDSMIAEAKKYFDGEVIIAYDGLEMDV